ncbi:MAG TPA: PH domain-containing protein [Candidatus Saccharimonadales bacterium]|nr:PH domain-containing protein [Candidatus Saccharimonadales bacterium]
MEDKPQQSPTQPQQQPPNNTPQPVAYDTNGNPLYAAPPPQQPYVAPSPQVVHLSRAVDPVHQELTPEVKKRHEQSLRDHPHLNLSRGEYIILGVRRHMIGLAVPVGMTVFLIALTASILINFSLITATMAVVPPFGPVLLAGIMFILLVTIGGYIAIWVYMNNKFFLTNESVIQELQTSLFVRKEQTVSLASIEDASYDQHGIIQTIFNYGSIRLSTEGDETTYRFSYVANPKKQIAILNNAVEAFKNGRPVVG